VDALGNAFIAGWTSGSLGGPNAGRSDAFLAKYDASGNLLWTRQFGTSDYDYGTAVAADTKGNVYIAGHSSRPWSDAFIAKYDGSGNLLWTREILGSEAPSLAVDVLGNVYVCGDTCRSLGGPNAGDSDAYVSKYNGDGNLLWTCQLGTSASDESSSVAVDKKGNVYFSGWTYGSLGAPNAAGRDALLVRLRPVPPHFTQGNGSDWADDPLLGSSTTIKKAGCYVSSIAMMLNLFGHNVNPGELNRFLSDVIPGTSPRLAFGSIPQSTNYGQIDGFAGLPVSFDTKTFGKSLSRGELVEEIGQIVEQYGPVFLRVPQWGRGEESFPEYKHAIIAWKVEDGQIFIRDPGSPRSGLDPTRDLKTLTLDDYVAWVNGSVGNPKFRLDTEYGFLLDGKYTYAFVKESDSPDRIRGAAHSPIEFVITDPMGRRVGYDPVLGMPYLEIPESDYWRVGSIVAPDGTLVLDADEPIDFQIGEVLDGAYTLEVFGLGPGSWSINLGIDSVSGFDPRQLVFAGTVDMGSYQRLTFYVPEPAALGLLFIGGLALMRRRRKLLLLKP